MNQKSKYTLEALFYTCCECVEYGVALDYIACWPATSHSDGSEIILCEALGSYHLLNDHNVSRPGKQVG